MTRRLTTLTLAALACTTLAGCATQSGPEQSPTPTASATETPTPTPTEAVAPTQEPVDVPTTSEEALAGADQTVKGYQQVVFDLLQDPSLGVEYLYGYVLEDSNEARARTQAVEFYVEGNRSVAGEPAVWSSNLGMSRTGVLTPDGGDEIQHGAVTLFGCADSSQMEFLINGEPNPDVLKGDLPVRAELVFDWRDQKWKITDYVSLVDAHGNPTESLVPQC